MEREGDGVYANVNHISKSPNDSVVAPLLKTRNTAADGSPAKLPGASYDSHNALLALYRGSKKVQLNFFTFGNSE
jgi:hypothetical protein